MISSILFVPFVLFGLASSMAPEDDLDRALRSVTAFEYLVEGEDWYWENSSEGPIQILPGLVCYTQSNLRCTSQSMHCKYVDPGTVCIYCDGAGGMFIAMNGFCVQESGSFCTVTPGSQSLCGKQRRSSCAGIVPNLLCTTVATPSIKDCHVKECV